MRNSVNGQAQIEAGTNIWSQPGVSSKGRLFLILSPLLGYGIFIAESVFAFPNPLWALLLLAWALCATGLAWWLMLDRARKFLDSLDRHATKVAITLIALAGIGFVLTSAWQARHFALGPQAEDTAYYSQVLWNTLHGNFLAGNVQQERLYNPPVSNDMALHFSPVLWMFLPLYALAPHFLTLLIIRDIALAVAAWPLFLLARERMSATAGLLAVVLYLANPAVIAQAAEAFYFVQLAPLALFAALRGYLHQDFGRFVVWMTIGLSFREDVAILMTGFGLLALAMRRPIHWAAVALAVPVAWWCLVTLIIQPSFGHWGNHAFEVAFAQGERARFGLYQVLFGDPAGLLAVLANGGLEYLYRLLRAVGFVCLMGPEGMLAIPGALSNLFYAQLHASGIDPFSRLALLPSCALVGAAVVIVSRVRWPSLANPRACAIAALFLVPSASLMDGVKDAVQYRYSLYTVINDSAALREALEHIPPTASVAAPNYALPALSQRGKLFYLQYLHMYPQALPDYILVDVNLDRVTSNSALRERYSALLRKLADASEYESVWQRGQYLLLRRGSSKL